MDGVWKVEMRGLLSCSGHEPYSTWNRYLQTRRMATRWNAGGGGGQRKYMIIAGIYVTTCICN